MMMTGHGGHVPPLLQITGHGGTASGRTANKKLNKLYWPSRKRSPKRLIVLLHPKVERHNHKFFIRRLAPEGCPQFQIRSGPLPPHNYRLHTAFRHPASDRKRWCDSVGTTTLRQVCQWRKRRRNVILATQHCIDFLTINFFAISHVNQRFIPLQTTFLTVLLIQSPLPYIKLHTDKLQRKTFKWNLNKTVWELFQNCF